MTDAYIVGTGIHPFGRHAERSGLEQGTFAVRQALADAGVEWADVQVAFGGSDSAGNADTMVNRLGLTSIPFTNVYNGCATGGSALAAAQNAIAAGADLALAVGFDKHPRGAFNPLPSEWGLPDWFGETGMMLTTQFFAMKLRAYMNEHGIDELTLARVAEKAFANGAACEHAWRRTPLAIDEILQSQMVNDPLTKLMFCSPAEGGCAVLLASPKKARELGRDTIRLAGVVVKSRPPGVFEVFSPCLDVERGATPTQLASHKMYEQSSIGPEDIDIAQIQDTESGAEVMHMAENGFCPDGDQPLWLAEGRTQRDGRLPTNTDGGCLACGEPIGASGLRQIHENFRQLAGKAGRGQVEKPLRTAYSQVQGAPGIACVTIMYK